MSFKLDSIHMCSSFHYDGRIAAHVHHLGNVKLQELYLINRVNEPKVTSNADNKMRIKCLPKLHYRFMV